MSSITIAPQMQQFSLNCSFCLAGDVAIHNSSWNVLIPMLNTKLPLCATKDIFCCSVKTDCKEHCFCRLMLLLVVVETARFRSLTMIPRGASTRSLCPILHNLAKTKLERDNGIPSSNYLTKPFCLFYVRATPEPMNPAMLASTDHRYAN